MPATAHRLVIAAPAEAGPEPPAAWPTACRLALAIDEAAARLLWAKLPVTLTLPARADAAETVRRLQKAGATAAVTPHPFRADPCVIHPRAAADEVCPKCGERRACALCLAAEDPALCPRCAGRTRFFTRFRRARIAFLFSALVFVALFTWNDHRRVTSWKAPLAVTIVPVDVGGDPDVSAWVEALEDERFAEIAAFFAREAEQHGLDLDPVVELRLAPVIDEAPPAEPEDLASRWRIAMWSLRLRAWNFATHRRHALPRSTVTIYVVYERDAGQIPKESLGLEQGRIGVVRTLAGARDAGWTNVTIAHELLHTVGATDKYAAGGLPIAPDGFADPDREPLFPQDRAEIMAGQIQLDAKGSFRQARSLDACVIGPKTAREIGWPTPKQPLP